MKHLQTLAIIAVISFSLSSCDTRSCENVICPSARHYCLNGECICPQGYEGPLCETFSYLKFTGSYQVSERCTTQLRGNLGNNYTSNIYQGGAIDEIIISNFGGFGTQVRANINGIFIAIPPQNIGSMTVDFSEGYYKESTRQIIINYAFTNSFNGYSVCTDVIFTPY